MAADGSLQRWAEAVADRLIRAFEATERFIFGFYEINEITLTAERVPGLFERIGNAIDRVAAVMKPLTDRFGTFETIAAAAGLVIAGPIKGHLHSLNDAFRTEDERVRIEWVSPVGSRGSRVYL